MTPTDPFASFKAVQRKAWGPFSPMATSPTPPAARLVEFAGLGARASVLDVACCTGVVAVTAARRGAQVCGLDLSPVPLEDARKPALSPRHFRANLDLTAGPVIKLQQTLKSNPPRLAPFRAEFNELIGPYFKRNRIRQSFLLTRAIKRRTMVPTLRNRSA